MTSPLSPSAPPADTTAPAEVDVLVVGGGINGAGIARDLAGRGWRVLLCEQDDLASHTSSASTKLVHGGLRYREHREFGLVRLALQEREVLLRSAPHLIRPMRFVMPHDPSMRPAWMIAAAMGVEIAPGPHEAELDYLQREESACSGDGVLWRRSKLGLHYNAAECGRVSAWMADNSGQRRKAA